MESQTTSITATRPPQFDTTDLSRDALRHIFADARRRAALRVMATADDAIEIDALAEAVAEEELCGESAAGDRFDRVVVSLHRQHLPMLAGHGLLETERRDDRVFVHPNTDELAALL